MTDVAASAQLEASQRSASRNGAVAIAIVGYRNADDIRTCLAALTRLTEKNFIVSICENGGAQSYHALIEAIGDIVTFEGAPSLADGRVAGAKAGRLQGGGQPVRIYRATGNLGYAGGVNVSLGQLGPDDTWSALWILNPDTEPHPDALSALIARAREGYGIVGSRLIFKSTQRVQCYGGYWRPTMASARNIGMNAPRDAMPDIAALERTMEYVNGASLFATRACVDEIGPLDESYFLYCEEIDWVFRRGAHRLGYAHDSIVYHAHGATIGSNKNRRMRSALSVYLDERNRHLFTRRFFPARYPLVFLTTLLFTLQYVRAGAIRNFVVALDGWFAGVRGEEGLPKRFAKPEAAP
jgi:N-acetylglucosaminyl-diphospho-decaprenol L-rhamnosyltransferase